MKLTKDENRIIIELDDESKTVNQILALIKDYEETHRCGSEVNRSLGFIGAAVVDEVRADTAYQLLNKIEKLLNK